MICEKGLELVAENVWRCGFDVRPDRAHLEAVNGVHVKRMAPLARKGDDAPQRLGTLLELSVALLVDDL